MSFPFPIDAPNDETLNAPWLNLLYDNASYRFATGLSGFYYTFLKGILGDTIEQLLMDSLMLPYVDRDESPEDAVKFIGAENGIIRYAGESDASYRARVQAFWSTVIYYGTNKAIIDFFETAGYGTPQIIQGLSGTVVDIPPAKSGPVIPAYPSSKDHWSQFVVLLHLGSALGSGTESDIVSDEQLATMRNFIRQAKPVDWMCREIIITLDPSLSVPKYNDGHEYDGSIDYADLNNLPHDFIYERHKGMI